MLTLFDSFGVPDVPHVQIYRDDEKRHKFYLVSERASIVRDEDGTPLFTFILYARDVERLAPEEREVERGFLQVTTQAGVSAEERQKVMAYLRQRLADDQRRGVWFLRLPFTQTEPELGYPPLWLSGTVEFSAVTPAMVTYSAGSKEPSLIDSNVASFAAELNQDGAELFRQAVEQKGNVLAGVQYRLAFAAKIPAIRIIIEGDRGEFYKEVRNYIHRKVVTEHRASFLGITYLRSSFTHEWSELASITKFRDTFHNLTITVDDSGLPDDDRSEMKDKLEAMAFEIFQTNVLPSFFEPAAKEVAQEQQDPARAVPVNTETTGRIHLEITRSQLVEKKVNPSVQFSQALTAEEVKALTSYLDLSQTFFQELDVAVNANVNFTADPVYALKVFLSYDQQDDVRGLHVKKAKEFLFRDASMVGRFRQVMAKGADGAPKDQYAYWSEISYKDTGETIRVPRTGSVTTNERQLVISYRRLGFLKVGLLLGVMPDHVKSVQVAMAYPGYAGPSAKQTFELTREKPTATFFTYTGQAGDPGPYRYALSYALADGQRMDVPEQVGQGETLTIPDPFEQTVSARFMAQADFTVVEKIVLDARYRDPGHDFAADHHAEFTKNGDTSTWTLGLREPGHTAYEYDVTILYKNGSRADQPARPGAFGASVAVGEGAVDALEVTVIASTADWSKYKLVLVYLHYQDPAHHLDEEINFTFRTDDAADRQWKVLLRDEQLKSYRYRVRYVGVNAADHREIPWTTTEDPILVIE